MASVLERLSERLRQQSPPQNSFPVQNGGGATVQPPRQPTVQEPAPATQVNGRPPEPAQNNTIPPPSAGPTNTQGQQPTWSGGRVFNQPPIQPPPKPPQGPPPTSQGLAGQAGGQDNQPAPPPPQGEGGQFANFDWQSMQPRLAEVERGFGYSSETGGVEQALQQQGIQPGSAEWDYFTRVNPEAFEGERQAQIRLHEQRLGQGGIGVQGGTGYGTDPETGLRYNLQGAEYAGGDPSQVIFYDQNWNRVEAPQGAAERIAQQASQQDRQARGQGQPRTQQQTPGPVRYDRVPQQWEINTLPPNAQVETPFGSISRNAQGQWVGRLNDAGRRASQEALQRGLRRFGMRPLANRPDAPSPTIRPGQPYFNPFTGQWGKG